MDHPEGAGLRRAPLRGGCGLGRGKRLLTTEHQDLTYSISPSFDLSIT